MPDAEWLKVPPLFERSQNQTASLADTRPNPCPLLSPPWWEWHVHCAGAQSSRAHILHCCYTSATSTELWESLDGLFCWKQKKNLVCNWEIHFQWVCHERIQRLAPQQILKCCHFHHGKSGEPVQWSRHGLVSARELNLLQSPLCPAPILPQLGMAWEGEDGWWDSPGHQGHHSTHWTCLWALPALNIWRIKSEMLDATSSPRCISAHNCETQGSSQIISPVPDIKGFLGSLTSQVCNSVW